jgi:hypothetical protein
VFARVGCALDDDDDDDKDRRQHSENGLASSLAHAFHRRHRVSYIFLLARSR